MLPAPTELDVRASLRRQFGAAASEVLWSAACRACAVRRTGPPLAAAELRPIADHFVAQGGALRVLGQSLRIRIATHLLLAGRRPAPLASAAS